MKIFVRKKYNTQMKNKICLRMIKLLDKKCIINIMNKESLSFCQILENTYQEILHGLSAWYPLKGWDCNKP
jgi:hypothetical protein